MQCRKTRIVHEQKCLHLLFCFKSNHIWHTLSLLHKFYELSAHTVLSCILKRTISKSHRACVVIFRAVACLGAGQLQKTVTLGHVHSNKTPDCRQSFLCLINWIPGDKKQSNSLIMKHDLGIPSAKTMKSKWREGENVKKPRQH